MPAIQWVHASAPASHIPIIPEENQLQLNEEIKIMINVMNVIQRLKSRQFYTVLCEEGMRILDNMHCRPLLIE